MMHTHFRLLFARLFSRHKVMTRQDINPVRNVMPIFQAACHYVFVEESTGRTIAVTLGSSAVQRFKEHNLPADKLALYAARWTLEQPEPKDAVDLSCESTLTALFEDYCPP
jgi:hypothetical protein